MASLLVSQLKQHQLVRFSVTENDPDPDVTIVQVITPTKVVFWTGHVHEPMELQIQPDDTLKDSGGNRVFVFPFKRQ